ncbi:hypothetical protein NIES2100_69140 [Calothrix sp. NIES-2100]|nr:hypothetical protein NIES2100_69140 [Calothrix sp. NIES-2100]
MEVRFLVYFALLDTPTAPFPGGKSLKVALKKGIMGDIECFATEKRTFQTSSESKIVNAISNSSQKINKCDRQYSNWVSQCSNWVSQYNNWVSQYSNWVSQYSNWVSQYSNWVRQYSNWVCQYNNWVCQYSNWVRQYSNWVCQYSNWVYQCSNWVYQCSNWVCQSSISLLLSNKSYSRFFMRLISCCNSSIWRRKFSASFSGVWDGTLTAPDAGDR